MNTKPVGVKTIPLQQFTTFSALASLRVFSDSAARDDIVHLTLWHFSTLSICLLSMLLSVTSRQAAEPPATDTGLPYLRNRGRPRS